jgi:hypothetical protein
MADPPFERSLWPGCLPRKRDYGFSGAPTAEMGGDEMDLKNSIMTGETVSCRWDPDDPELCFEADACGCYIDPCTYFGFDADLCRQEPCEACCTLIDTC